MREQAGLILKALCLVLAALLLYQLLQMARRVNPLSQVTIPALPKLASDTNAPDSGKGRTNSAQVKAFKGTNAPGSDAGTNLLAAKGKKVGGTNATMNDLLKAEGTNIDKPLATSVGTNENLSLHPDEKPVSTNSSAPASGKETANSETNPPAPAAAATATTNDLPAATGTNLVATTPTVTVSSVPADAGAGPTNAGISGTNVSLTVTGAGTNKLSAASNSVTNAKTTKQTTHSSAPPGMALAGMNPVQMRGGGKPADLPPEIKARVDRIYESELFGMVMHPVPMGLLGIAGNSAILRSPSGQTGLVKEGDSLGELKLLRIGTNRVLVEQDGKKSELMIFDGYGGESLMPKDKETSK